MNDEKSEISILFLVDCLQHTVLPYRPYGESAHIASPISWKCQTTATGVFRNAASAASGHQ